MSKSLQRPPLLIPHQNLQVGPNLSIFSKFFNHYPLINFLFKTSSYFFATSLIFSYLLKFFNFFSQFPKNHISHLFFLGLLLIQLQELFNLLIYRLKRVFITYIHYKKSSEGPLPGLVAH